MRIGFACCIVGTLFTSSLAEETTVSLPGIVKFEDGRPAANFRISQEGWEARRTNTTDEKGKFIIQVPPGHAAPLLTATSPDGKMMGIFSQYEREEFVRITVKPPRTVTTKLVDGKGQPVPDAEVMLFTMHRPIVVTKSNAEGIAELQYPADTLVQWILALKPGAGSDYFENIPWYPPEATSPIPEHVELKLDGAQTAKIKVVDTKNQPVEGVQIVPWLIDRLGKTDDCNMGGYFSCRSPHTISDADGRVDVSWLPKDLTRSVTMLIISEDYFCGSRPSFKSGSKEVVLVRVQRVPEVSGVVTMPDGKPAVGIKLQAESEGGDYLRVYTTTDENGKYHLKLHPDQNTTIAVTDPQMAAPSIVNLMMTEGEKKLDADFELSAGTLIHGVLTVGPNKDPFHDDYSAYATLIEKTGGRVVRWSHPDEFGNYSFRVGPGEFELSLPQKEKAESITVTDQKEVVRHYHARKRSRINTTGLVVDDKNQPVGNCEVFASRIFGEKVKTKKDGTFIVDRATEDAVMVARLPDRNLGATQLIFELEEHVEIKLEAAGTAIGRLIDENNQPIPNRAVKAFISADENRGCPAAAITDANGEFRIPGVPVGCVVKAYVSQGVTSALAMSIKVEEAKEVRANDCKLAELKAAE